MKRKIWQTLVIFTIIGSITYILSSCSKDDDVASATTYTIKWNFETSLISDVTAFEYAENGDKIGNHRIENLEKNGSYTFTASDKTAKVKVYFKIGSNARWVQNVFYLTAGKNTDIAVNDDTLVGAKEP